MSRVTRYQKRLTRSELAFWIICAILVSPILIIFMSLEFSFLLHKPYLESLKLVLKTSSHYPYPLAFIGLSLEFLLLSLQFGKFYITETDIRVGLHPRFCLRKHPWYKIESIEWEKQKAILWIHQPKSPLFFGIKKFALWFPLNNPEAFKTDILNYAPEGNPLRDWVESEQFSAIHN